MKMLDKTNFFGVCLFAANALTATLNLRQSAIELRLLIVCVSWTVFAGCAYAMASLKRKSLSAHEHTRA